MIPLPPDVEKITGQAKSAVDTIFDKRATWMLVAVVALVSFVAGAVVF